MHTQGNTILITGGGAGIGRGLAEAFHQLGSRVVIAGRRKDVLEQTCAANPGMSYLVLDVADGNSIRNAAREATSRFPDLNWLINNAGVQREHDFSADEPLDENAMAEEIDTNVVGLIRMCAAFLPHLRTKPSATLVNVSSGLAFVPLARVPIYCATKAAVHSFTLSLRRQLRGSSVKVVELIPPYVDTHLDAGRRRPGGPAPMPLPDFIQEAMAGLTSSAEEVTVGTSKYTRAAATGERWNEIFTRMNG